MWIKIGWGIVKGAVLNEVRKFSWSAREKQRGQELGLTEEEIKTSEKVNKLLLPEWVDRQFK